MKDLPVTPRLLHTFASQVGFDRFRLTDELLVMSILRVPGRPGVIMPQLLGPIVNVQGFLDWCTSNDYDVEDWTVQEGAD